MSSRARVGILGGTFDPIHNGHVAVATAARQALGLDRVWLLPTRVPPHRPLQPKASIFHRFAMTALAAMSVDGLETSDRDLDGSGPSYTADLLATLHGDGWDPSQIVFILGADAFADIEKWHLYPAVLNRAHFTVVSRPGRAASSLPARLTALADRYVTVGETAPTARLDAAQPAIFLIDTPTPDISSSNIRARLHGGSTVDNLVPPDVARYIARHRLYGADTSTAGHLHEHTA
jgi:nicotinate-nucleotide adenylyltransferase